MVQAVIEGNDVRKRKTCDEICAPAPIARSVRGRESDERSRRDARRDPAVSYSQM